MRVVGRLKSGKRKQIHRMMVSGSGTMENASATKASRSTMSTCMMGARQEASPSVEENIYAGCARNKGSGGAASER